MSIQNTSSPRLIRVITLGAAALISVGISGILPVLPSIAKGMGISVREASSIIAAFALPGFFIIPFYGVIADRLGRKAVLIPSLLLFLLGGIGSFSCTSFFSLIVFRAIHGAGAASLSLMSSTLIADTWEGEERVKMMGISGMALGIGTGVSPALGGLLGLFGWRWAFLLSLLALPLLFLCLKSSLYKAPTQAKHTKSVSLQQYLVQLKKKALMPQTLFFFGLTFCAFIILSGPVVICFPHIAAESFKASPLAIGFIMSAASLVSAGAASGLSALYKKFTSKQLLLYGQLGYLLFLLGLAASPVFFSSFSPALLFIPLVFYGFAQGVTIPLLATLLSNQSEKDFRASLMAINAMIMRLAQAVGSVLFSVIASYKNPSVACLVGLVPIAVIVYFLLSIKIPDKVTRVV